MQFTIISLLVLHGIQQDLSLPFIVKVLKAHPNRKDEKTGHGVVFLPGTVQELRDKLATIN